MEPAISTIEADSFLKSGFKHVLVHLSAFFNNSQYHFIGKKDRFLLLIAYILALIAGVCPPIMILIFTKLMEKFVVIVINKQIQDLNPNLNRLVAMKWLDFDEVAEGVSRIDNETLYFAVKTILMATILFFSVTIFVILLNSVSQRMVFKARQSYFAAILRKDYAWFDVRDPKVLSESIINDPSKMEDGLGEKLGFLLMNFSCIITSTVICVIYAKDIALYLIIFFPVVGILQYLKFKIQEKLKDHEQNYYFQAEYCLQVLFKNFQQVKVYNGEDNEFLRYRKNLKPAEIAQIRSGTLEGLIDGLYIMMVYFCYAAFYFYGVKLIVHPYNEYTVYIILLTFFCIQLALINAIRLKEYYIVYYNGKRAAKKIVEIERHHTSLFVEQRYLIGLALRPNILLGFENVTFSYPSRPKIPALINCTFEINANEHVVVTGPNNGGKTTIMRLIHRFYDPQYGKIIFDGRPLKERNLNWLRWRIGFLDNFSLIVGETIRECILSSCKNKSLEDVIAAAKLANIHEEILKLPKEYESSISMNFSLQFKQKLALARVIIRKPSLLIMDNATSALSRDDEKKLYDNLFRVSIKAIITVTPRISLMKTANVIFFIKNGILEEFGPFDDLMAAKGKFASTVNRTLVGMDLSDEDDIIQEFDSTGQTGFPEYNLNKPIGKASKLQSFNYYLVYNSNIYHQYPLTISPSQFSKHTAKTPYRRTNSLKMFGYSLTQWPFVFIAWISAVLTGLSFAAYAILFGECLEVIATDNFEGLSDDRVNFYGELFIIAGVIMGLTIFIKGYMISHSSAKLATRLRKMILKVILTQNLEWFVNYSGKSVSTLLYTLRVHTINATHVAGLRILQVIEIGSMIIASAVLASYYHYQFSTLIVLLLPFLLIATFLQSEMLLRQSIIAADAFNRAKLIAYDSILNIAKIISGSLEVDRIDAYNMEIVGGYSNLSDKFIRRAVIFGVCNALPFYVYAVLLYYGGVMLRNNEIEFENLFKIIEAIVLGTILISELNAYSSAVIQDHLSCADVINILNEKKISRTEQFAINQPEMITGNIEFYNLNFKPNTQILPQLHDFNVSLREGVSYAFVGKIGSGIESPIPLLLRMYDCTSGTISINNKDIKTINPDLYYQRIGVVNPDLIFYGRSIAENIAYGSYSHYASMDEIISAAKEANLHNWVTTLVDEYDTLVRNDPYNLTTSQRIRLSLARAIIREPALLLIDRIQMAESEDSEQIVRKAIKKAIIGRSCVMSSHHLLSSVQEADYLIFIHKGKVYDIGTHADLMRKQQLYYRIYNQQLYDFQSANESQSDDNLSNQNTFSNPVRQTSKTI